MAIRLPLTTVLDHTVTDDGGASVLGGVPLSFKIPQDTDNIVVKLLASVAGAGVSAVFQTSDDGGSTYYDVARTSIVSNNGATAVAGSAAEWLSIPTISSGVNPIVRSNAAAGSVLGGTIGSASASTLGSRQVSGLPVLGLQNRIFLIYSGNITTTTNNTRVQVKVNNQSATA